MARLRAYIDGLNLFYGCLKGQPTLKWLDIRRLVTRLSPGDELDTVRYFTAIVSGRMDPGCPRRQDVYLRALRAGTGVTVHLGRFRSHPVDMPLAVQIAGQPTMARVIKTEEKGSDVNLATYLLLDGFDGMYDEALVISNDSDLVEPISIANTRFGPVHVVSPNQHHNAQMASVAASYRRIPAGLLVACQLPFNVQLPGGRSLRRPAEWM